jgi:hypothetical protein
MDELLAGGNVLLEVAAFPERVGKASASLPGVDMRTLMLPEHVIVTFTFDDATVHFLGVEAGTELTCSATGQLSIP